jgi:hypothetical protein
MNPVAGDGAMAAGEARFETPYARFPGSSTPSPETTPKEGIGDFWTFFWLAIANTTIIGAAGVVTWLLVHHP